VPVYKRSMNHQAIPVPSLEFQLTDTCQNNCGFCANGDSPSKKQSLSPELLQETFRRMRPESVIFSGGEPTIRMDLLAPYIRAARAAEVKTVKINTNLELLDPERLMQLEDAGLNIVHFALNTLEPEQHRNLRGNPHAEVTRVLENIHVILEQTRLKLKPEFVCMHETVENFWDVYDYLNDLHVAHPGRFETIELQRLILLGRACDASAPKTSEIAEIISRRTLGALQVDALCFGQEGAQFAPYGIHVFPCYNPANCGCSPVRVDVNGGVSKTNFAGLQADFNIMNVPDGGIERLLSSPCSASLKACAKV